MKKKFHQYCEYDCGDHIGEIWKSISRGNYKNINRHNRSYVTNPDTQLEPSLIVVAYDSLPNVYYSRAKPIINLFEKCIRQSRFKMQ